MTFKDPEKAREYWRHRSRIRYGDERRKYERERKRKKRLEKINALPEPERSQALARLRGPYKIENRIYY